MAVNAKLNKLKLLTIKTFKIMEIFKTQKDGRWYRLIIPSTCWSGGCLYELQKYQDNGWWKYVRSFPTVESAKEYINNI